MMKLSSATERLGTCVIKLATDCRKLTYLFLLARLHLSLRLFNFG